MATVNITIRNTNYQIACEDGQEADLKLLAKGLEAKVSKIASGASKASDILIVIMAALLAEDEISDYKKVEKQNNTAESSEALLIDTMDAISEYVENLAVKIDRDY